MISFSHKFLELYRTFTDKKILDTNFPYNRLTQTLQPHPLNSQNLLSMTKEFNTILLTL